MKQRLISLDAFRGITIIGMIIVNTPGSWSYIYPPLRHAEWNGLTPTDLVFPFFLFIVGVSIVLSLSKIKGNTDSRSKKPVIRRIIKRAIILFGIGILLNLIGSNFQHLRLPGVLQRIAIVYLACALLYLYFSLRTQIITGILILIGYFLAMTLIQVPGFNGEELLSQSNVATWLDDQVIPFYLYQKTWDPEGILSTLPSIVTAILGMITGNIILSQRKLSNKIVFVFILGFGMLFLGELWSWVFPINKNMWTSSYVLYTGGLAAMSLAFLIFVIDQLEIRKWAKPAIEFGSNAITAYILSNLVIIPAGIIILNGQSLQELYMNGLINWGVMPEFASLIWAIVITLICYIPIKILYNKSIFIKV